MVAPLGGPALSAALEAVLLVVDEPVSEVTLAQVVERPRGEVSRTLHDLAREYDSRAEGSSCATSPGDGATTPEPSYAPVVERFVLDGQQARLTQAALETFAVVAYRQPVSRARIAGDPRRERGRGRADAGQPRAHRGGRDRAGVSQALLYRTTPLFLERLGLGSAGGTARVWRRSCLTSSL